MRASMIHCKALHPANIGTFISGYSPNGLCKARPNQLRYKTTSRLARNHHGQHALVSQGSRPFTSPARNRNLHETAYDYEYLSFSEERRRAISDYPHLKDKKARREVIDILTDAQVFWKRNASLDGSAPGTLSIPDDELFGYLMLQREYNAACCLESPRDDFDAYKIRKNMSNRWERHKPGVAARLAQRTSRSSLLSWLELGAIALIPLFGFSAYLNWNEDVEKRRKRAQVKGETG